MTAISAYALTSLADVKETLGIANSNTAKDNLIIRKINQATGMIEDYCNLAKDHHFQQATYTNEEYNATNTNQLILQMKPVSAVTDFGVRQTSLNVSTWNTLDSKFYFLDGEAGTLRIDAVAVGNWNRYRVSYTAGYSPIPDDLAEACAELAGYMTSNPVYNALTFRKREGQREIHFYQQPAGEDLIEALGLGGMLARYVNLAIID